MYLQLPVKKKLKIVHRFKHPKKVRDLPSNKRHISYYNSLCLVIHLECSMCELAFNHISSNFRFNLVD